MALTQVKSDGIADGAVTTNDLSDSGVTAGTYGSSSAIPAITVDAKGRITSASTNSVTQVGGANGVDFNDAVKARFGTGNDLEIYHNGHSIIADVGDGQLQLRTNAFRVQNAAGTETQISTNEDGAVNLAFDGNDKLSTTSTGIDVNGNVQCDTLTVNGNGTINGVGTIQSSTGVLVLRDNNSSDAGGAQNYIEGRTSDAVARFRIGDVSANGHVYISNLTSNSIYFQTGGTSRCHIDSSGHFIPAVTNTYDLGSSSVRWRNVYTNDLNLSNEDGANDVDGTWGSWTIQEGEENLFLLNRRNGKKYKFNLTEVN